MDEGGQNGVNWGKELKEKQEEVKSLASRIMHSHYEEHDAEWITTLFLPQFSWFGTGEEEYLTQQEACVRMFLEFKDAIPDCNIIEEEYEMVMPRDGVYIVTGRMWITTAPSAQMFLKVHQRVTFVFLDTPEGLRCAHIHCSNPYQEMLDGEHFPEKIGRQSYEYVQERLAALEEETKQQNRQLEVIMSSIAGGLKISNDDDTYSFAFVSREAAALFGYTVEEFMEATGGCAVGNVYPPDLPGALADCAEAFRDGGLTYSTRYRVRCKDGSLKWVIDSGKKAQDADGNWVVNSLYLDVTRSEEDAQQLREQTRLLTSIYDTVPCGIIRFTRGRDDSYRLISLNKAVLSLMDYDTMEEGLNDWHEGVLGSVLLEDRIALQKTFRKLSRVGEREDSEYRVRWKDGSIHWMEGTNMIVGTTAEGETILQRTMVDITPRKRLQQRLSREQEMYRVAMEASAAVMFEYLMDQDLFISYEPRTGQGVLRSELKDYSRILLKQQIVHPDDIHRVIDNICHGRTEVFEVRCTTPESAPGNFTWFRVNSRLMMENGHPSRVVGTMHNIDDVKTILSENEARLHMNQSALQAINDVYVSIYYVNLCHDSYYAVRLPEADKGGSISRTGRYSEDLCSYILADADGEDAERMSAICDREWLLKELAGTNDYIEVEYRHKKTALWLRMEIHLVAAADGRRETVIMAFRNISAEKQRELEYFEEEKRAKRALEDAYASVNRANQAKSDFLSRMSHDIRTPMNAILGMTAIARNNLERKEKLTDCLSKISLSGEHLLDLINEVLDMSKIESGNISLSEEPVQLDGLLQNVSQIIRPDLEKKSQEYAVEIKDLHHNSVYGDAVRIKQILLNLLSNAVKYTPVNGHIRVTLDEKLSSESGVGCFEFVVEDDGIGMTPEFMKKLFMPFERAEDSRVSQIQGTGLGLSITQNLVQMMNGTIQVESRMNEGARFVVTVFLKLAGESDTTRLCPPKTGAKVQAGFPVGTRVLLAEDNQLNREIAEELLSLSGLEVVSVANGREAAERFAADPPGTHAPILMDIQMPVLDGYGAARAVRKMGEGGERPDALEIPIIALTANAFADDVYRAKQAGMNEHVAKPLELDRLLEVMHRWID
ncbi:ATP-binding protein [Eisenbergiella sp.]